MPQQDGLEYINTHTLPCGCVFLLAWPETRTRDHPDHPYTRDTHDIARDGELQYRIVKQDEAERIVDRKRAHPLWEKHVVGKDSPQPNHYLCEKHASLVYNLVTYRQISVEYTAIAE